MADLGHSTALTQTDREREYSALESSICDVKLAASNAAFVVENQGEYEVIEGRGRGIWLDDATYELLTFTIYQVEKRAEELKARYYGETAAAGAHYV